MSMRSGDENKCEAVEKPEHKFLVKGSSFNLIIKAFFLQPYSKGVPMHKLALGV
jgi:hypothetical protein